MTGEGKIQTMFTKHYCWPMGIKANVGSKHSFVHEDFEKRHIRLETKEKPEHPPSIISGNPWLFPLDMTGSYPGYIVHP